MCNAPTWKKIKQALKARRIIEAAMLIYRLG
jgi:hypothetical protein